jgi:hypothetical protein
MIEHWPYDDSVRAIQEQAACARTVLVAILTQYTRFGAGVTDERFYSRRELAEMLRAAGLRNVRVFGYGDVPGTIGRVSRSLLSYLMYRTVGLPAAPKVAQQFSRRRGDFGVLHNRRHPIGRGSDRPQRVGPWD